MPKFATSPPGTSILSVAQRGEPIAIVGAGCRLPGGIMDLDGLWQALRAGVDAVRPIPATRWQTGIDGAEPTYSRHMSAIDAFDQFDAGFFGISPREAASMDPQHRLLLECASEAIERAGWSPRVLAGSQTGVFVGIYSDDYPQERLYKRAPDEIDGHGGLAMMRGLAAGRIAYTFDLHGPVMALDAACASSLLAIHLACKSLRDGSATHALAGGVNLVLAPEITHALCQMQALSKTGRCRTFSADADGFVRGEACGVLALRRLSDATRDGDPILAVIHGSAVNHDGRSNGISAPNGTAQQAVIRAALADAGVTPEAVGYVEAHGTGTNLGDPIELRALGAVYGADRTAPLLVGSSKTNFGHTEAASGLVGILKVALALQHHEVPPNLHFSAPNPFVPWHELALTVPTQPMPFPDLDGRRHGAISAFGMSGTNVHMILGAAPAKVEAKCADTTHVAMLSAKSEAALRALARRHAATLATMPGADSAAVAWTLNTGRARHPVRAAVVFSDIAGLIVQLNDLADIASQPATRRHVKFRFDDDGRTAPEAIATLTETTPAFAAALKACADAGVGDDPATEGFAIAHALGALYRAAGIVPDCVIGEGAGEIAAASVAGVMSVADAAALLRARAVAKTEPDLDDARFGFIASVRRLRLNPPALPLYSGFLGRNVTNEVVSPSFWWAHLISANPLIVSPDDSSLTIPISPSGADRITMCRHLAAAICAGLEIDWTSVDYPNARLPLATHPFAATRFHIPRPAGRTQDAASQTPSITPGRGLVGTRLALAGSAESRFNLTLDLDRAAYLADHRIAGVATLPAAAFVEIALQNARAIAGTRGPISLDTLNLVRPVSLPASGAIDIQTVKAADGGWQLFSRGADDSWTLHATARLAETAPQSSLSKAPIGSVATEIVGSKIYDELAKFGLTYGPAFRGLKHVALTSDGVIARVAVPEAAAADIGDFLIHPSLLDACLVASSAILPPAKPGVTWIPRGMNRVTVWQAAGSAAICRLRLTSELDAIAARIDVAIWTEAGSAVAEIDGLAFGLIPAKTAASAELAPGFAATPVAGLDLLRMRWQRATLSGSVSRRPFVLISDDVDLRRRLALELTADGADVHELAADGLVSAEAAAAALARSAKRLCHVVYIATRPADPLAGQMPASHAALLHLLQAASQPALRSLIRLDVVTRGTQRVAAEPVTGIVEAGLWGLARVGATEIPTLGLTRIDLDPDVARARATEAADLAACLLTSPPGEELALRSGAWFAAHLGAEDATTQDRRIELPAYDGALPAAGEVLVGVVATGLNFRDVLHSMGLLPASAERMPYGLECSGRILAVGPDVADLAPGMSVIAALTVGSLAGKVRVPAAYVVPKPDALSFRDAATLPLAFLTAHYALDRLAGLKPGERVLIHAAAGGVGQAAIDVARRAGAEIFATASAGKLDHLRRQGVAHVFNSRSTDFADEILRLTGGRGVDVVLNSLSGDMIAASFKALAKDGRFVEIGKLGILSGPQVAALRPDVAYHHFDLLEVREDRPLIAAMMAEMLTRLADGSLTPLRSSLFAVTQADAAFQFMARARHIGKIVLWQAPATDLIDANGTYLITGGLGALGLHAAHWLVGHGARSIALVGRSGVRPEIEAAIAALRETGAHVEIHAADVSDPAEVDALIARIRQTTPQPLRGIIHAAGVLDDGLIIHQSGAKFERVLAPKLKAAWNLHQATRDASLDLFLLYSSVSGLIGTAGQANYAAANATLDAIASHRADLGLAGLAIDWGPWAGAGMAAHLSDVSVGRIAPASAAATLDQLILARPGQLAALPIGWQTGLRPSKLSGDVTEPPKEATSSPASTSPDLRRNLEASDAATRLRDLRAHVRTLAAKALDLPAASVIDPSRPLEDLGFDSLMNMELKAALEKDLGVKLGATLTYDYPSIDALVHHLAKDSLHWSFDEPAAIQPMRQGAELESALLAELDALNY